MWIIILLTSGALIGGLGARYLRLQPILGYVLCGILAGIFYRNFFQEGNLLIVFEVLFSLFLFALGLEYSLDRLRKVKKEIFFSGVFLVLLFLVAFFPLVMIMRYGLSEALFFAGVFSFSSSAVAINLMGRRVGISNTNGRNMLGFIFFQSIFVVPFFFLLPVVFTEEFRIALLSDFFVLNSRLLIVFLFILVFARRVFPKLVGKLNSFPTIEINFLVFLLMTTVTVGILLSVGASLPLSAFLAGIIFSSQSKNFLYVNSIRSVREILFIIFVVMLGMVIDFNMLLTIFLNIFLLTFLIVFVKYLLTNFVLKSNSRLMLSPAFAASYISNVGEVSILIGLYAYFQSYISLQSLNMLMGVYLLTIITTIYFNKHVDKQLLRVFERIGVGKLLRGEKVNVEIEDNDYLYRHVVICGVGNVGSEIIRLLEEAQIKYFVIESRLGEREFDFGEKTNFVIGDPSDVELLRVARVDDAKVLIVTERDLELQKNIIQNALKLNPQLKVLSVNERVNDRYELHNMGVNTIVVPEFEAGIRIGRAAFELYGISGRDISKIVKKVRKEHFID